MKIFGKKLFEFKEPPQKMYDFAQHGITNARSYGLQWAYSTGAAWNTGDSTTVSSPINNIVINEPLDKKTKKTPKELFNAKALNDNNFVIKVDEKYLSEQIHAIQDKLGFYGKRKKDKNGHIAFEDGGVRYGREELESILIRLKNRYRLKEVQAVVNQFPHTTTELIQKVINEHDDLSCRKADDFIPDFPKDAIAAMKEYDELCVELCNQKAVFYVIATNKDFEVKNVRRDPILLAQSPFGFFWQILGAWDKEMIYLGDL
jgi:hypothetical protein